MESTSSVKPLFSCAICYAEARNPVVTPCCTQIFCTQCISMWLQQNTSCPMCFKPLALKDLVQVKRLASSLQEVAFISSFLCLIIIVLYSALKITCKKNNQQGLDVPFIRSEHVIIFVSTAERRFVPIAVFLQQNIAVMKLCQQRTQQKGAS